MIDHEQVLKELVENGWTPKDQPPDSNRVVIMLMRMVVLQTYVELTMKMVSGIPRG